MKKRIISVLIALILSTATIIVSLPATAGGTNGLSVSKPTASEGETFGVTLTLPSISQKLATFQWQISFDKDNFEVTSFTPPEGSNRSYSTVAEANSNGKVSVSYMGEDGENTIDFSSGYTMTASFKVKTGAIPGNYSFNIIKHVTDELDTDGYTEIDRTPASLTDSVCFEVTAPPVPATGVSLNKETTSIVAGGTETLTATVTPDDSTDKVTWKSSNESVATVDSTGKVTAVTTGNATITATAGSYSDTCAVTVTCSHSLGTVSEKTSTCKEQGWDAYKECSKCHKLFKTDGTTELSAIPYREYAPHNYGSWITEVPATHDANGEKGHYHCSVCEKNFDSSKNELSSLVITKDANHGTPATAWNSDATHHWHECKVVGCGVVIDSTKATHTFEWKTDKPATEDETGLKHEECSVCGYKKNEGTPIDKLDHTHIGITHHAAVAATCKATGNIEYWTCSSSKCAGKYYSDSACQNEITTGITTNKNAANHIGEKEYRDSKPATCYAEGYEGDIYCLGCGAKIGTGKSITKLSHTPGDWETDATYHWKECTVVACGVVIDSTKAAHTGGEATCKNKAVCSVCGVEYGEKNADNHKNTTVINAKTPTCTEAGYTGDTYCNDCEKIVANGKSIVPNGHTPSEWKFDDDEHWQTCAVDGCGVEIADSRASHSDSEWIVDKEPTVKEEGSKHIECTVCRKVLKTESITKLIAYEITNGVNGKWTKESKENFSFTSNAEFAKFVEVRVDGKKISEGSFIVKEGSTVVTLKNDYLETLLVGKHTLAIVSSDGIAETSFEIEGTEKKDTPVSPLTGENSHITLWVILAFVSCLGVLALTLTRKKKSVR